MSSVQMPKKCLTCLFNTLCTEKKQCLEEELRQLSKIKFLKTKEETENQSEASQEARQRFERKLDFY